MKDQILEVQDLLLAEAQENKRRSRLWYKSGHILQEKEKNSEDPQETVYQSPNVL